MDARMQDLENWLSKVLPLDLKNLPWDSRRYRI
jgi:hypothetical protein